MDLATLEQAGNTILAPPNVVSNETRKQAEAVFQELKSNLTIDYVRSILGASSNQFVLFQVAQATGEMILNHWSLLSQEQIESVYKMLVEYVATTDSLTSYVVSEFLKSVAMILKRGSLDKKIGSEDELFDLIRNLLTNESQRLQSIGCQMISSITEQFSHHWRNKQFSITWDFHVRAKSHFEKVGLRKLLEMSLETLHQLCNQTNILSNEFTRRLCEKFLEVAESIFSWNFSSKIFRRMFALSQTSTSFRPPGSWQDLVRNDQFVPLFFQLHSQIRSDEALTSRSLSCLVQLAGLSGECMNDPEDAEEKFSDRFVRMFIENLLSLFAEGPLPHEIDKFCTIIQRLFIYRPIQSLMRLPHDGPDGGLRSRFFSYMSSYMIFLTDQAMKKAIGESDHGDHTSLSMLYDSWVVLLRGRWRQGLSEEEQYAIQVQLIDQQNWNIVNQFIRSVQAPPFGTRSASNNDEEDEEDDRVLFNDLLNPLGTMITFNIPQFLPAITETLRGRLVELQKIMQNQVPVSQLPAWQEDMHWLMLVIANSVMIEELDGGCCLVEEVYSYSADLCQQRNAVYDENLKQEYLRSCIENPNLERPAWNPDINPLINLFGEVLSWASIEHQLLTSASPEAISPEVTRSTMLCLRRFVGSISKVPEGNDYDPLSAPVLLIDGPFNEMFIRFCLNKVFAILRALPGEEKVCEDAVVFLTAFIDSRAACLASDPELFKNIAELDITKLPSRTVLMKVLVQIAAAAKNEEMQQGMYNKIIVPLSEKLSILMTQPSTPETESLITDIIQCFDGVAQGSDHSSGPTLANVLHPLLVNCVSLMNTHSHSPVLINAILQLLLDTSTRVWIYVEEATESIVLYEVLIEIIRAYCAGQQHRFVGLTSDDEEKAADLVLFLDVLSNVLAKSVFGDDNAEGVNGATVTLAALEMLLAVMNESLLQIPDLSHKFFKFICYLVEFSPENLKTMPNTVLSAICECLKTGLSSQFGTEISSLSLEGIVAISNYVGDHRDAFNPELVRVLVQLMPIVFDTCLEYSCENSLFSDASHALFSLIRLDRPSFELFVADLLSKKQNQEAALKLQTAFNELLPADLKMVGRKDRLDFRHRMERFLGDIQGLLITN